MTIGGAGDLLVVRFSYRTVVRWHGLGLIRTIYVKSRRPGDATAHSGILFSRLWAASSTFDVPLRNGALIEGKVMYGRRGSLGQWLIGMTAGVATLYGCDGAPRAAEAKRNVGWAMYNMGYDGVRSSPLADITARCWLIDARPMTWRG